MEIVGRGFSLFVYFSRYICWSNFNISHHCSLEPRILAKFGEDRNSKFTLASSLNSVSSTQPLEECAVD